MTDNEYKYWAFLNYSSQDNCEKRSATQDVGSRCWGDWLHDALKTFSIPAEFVGQINGRGEIIPERIDPIFRNSQELPDDATLSADIRKALEQSICLIVICSPRSAESLQVNEAVRYFKQLGRGKHILPIVVAGEPNASDGNKPGRSPADECFVPALRHPVQPDGTLDGTRRAGRAIFVDARHGVDKREILANDHRHAEADLEMAKIQLIALLLGVGFNGLWWREQKRHFFDFAEAQHQAREALNQVEEARRQLQEAQRQAREAQNQALEIQNLPRDVHGQIQEAQNQAQEAQNQTREVQKQLQEFQDKVRDTQTQLEAARDRTLAAESKVLEAQNQAREAQNQLEETRNQTREAQNKVVEIQNLSQDVPARIQEAQNQVLEAQNQTREAQKQLQEFQDKVRDTQAQLEEACNRTLAAESKVLEAQNQAREAQNQLEETRNQTREAQNKVLEIQNLSQDVPARIQEAQNQALEAQNQTREAQKQLQEFQDKVRDTQTQLEEARNRALAVESKVLEAQHQAQNTQGQLEETRHQAQDIHNKFLEAQSQVQEFKGQARSAQSQLEESRNQVREAQGKVLAAQNQAREMQNQIEEIQNQNRDAQSQIKSAQNQFQKIQNQSQNARRLTKVFALLAVLALLAAGAAASLALRQRKVASQAFTKAAAAAAGNFELAPGTLAQEQIAQVLRNIGGAEQDENRRRSLDELAAGIPRAEIPEALKASSVILDDQRRSHFQKWLLVRLGWVNPMSAMTYASAVAGKIVNDEGLVDSGLYFQLAVLDNWMKTDLSGAFNWVCQLPDADSRQRALENIIHWLKAQPDSESNNKALATCIGELAKTDIPRALALAESLPQGLWRRTVIAGLFNSWAARDLAAATQFASRHPELSGDALGEITEACFQSHWFAATNWIESLALPPEIMQPRTAPLPWIKLLLNANVGSPTIFPVATEILSNTTSGPIQIKPKE